MKKICLWFLACLMIFGLVFAAPQIAKADGEEAYAVYENNTLTFYYDTLKDSRTGTAYTNLRYTMSKTGFRMDWNSVVSDISTVVFHSSFINATPIDTSFWFSGCENLSTISDIQNLNTSTVTGMGYMFAGCSSLTTLDVTNFDTTNVIGMGGMFAGCSSLQTLDVTNFDTTNVTGMDSMFAGCSSLQTLDVTHFDTTNVLNMGGMFSGCSSLQTLDVTNFDTTNVLDMGSMFAGCSSLTELDLSNFVTERVENMEEMFQNCAALTTIFIDHFNFVMDRVISSDNMFNGCTNLAGSAGTKYADANPKDKTYAHIDAGLNDPGYFTDKPSDIRNLLGTSATSYRFEVTVTKDESTGIVKATLPIGYTGWTETNYPVLVSNAYKGYVFWGYSNDGIIMLKEVSDITDGTYALFFPPDVFNLFVQFRATSLSDDPDKTDLRLITSAPDVSSFSKLGFELKLYEKNSIVTSQAWDANSAEGNGFLQTVTGNSEGTIVTLTTDAFNPVVSKTLGLQTVVGMPLEFLTANIAGSALKGTILAVRPFLITTDGTKSYGVSHVFRVYSENGVYKAATWEVN